MSQPIFFFEADRIKHEQNQLMKKLYNSMMESVSFEVSKIPISMALVVSHNRPSDAWTAIDGRVYNITKFLEYHPGGGVIMECIGKDGTQLFHAHSTHTEKAHKILEKFYIGDVER